MVYASSLLLVASAMYAMPQDSRAARISEFTHGPLNAPAWYTLMVARAGTLLMSAPERCALRSAAKPCSSKRRT